MLNLDLWNYILQFLELYDIFNFYLSSKIQINLLKIFDKNKIENDNIFINTSKNMRYFIIYILRTIKKGNFLYIHCDKKKNKIGKNKYVDDGFNKNDSRYISQLFFKFKKITIIRGGFLNFEKITSNDYLESFSINLIPIDIDNFIKFIESCISLKQISIKFWMDFKNLIKLINIKHIKRLRIILSFFLDKDYINEILKLDLKNIHIATRKLFLYEQYKNYKKNLTMELIVDGHEYIILNKK